MTRDVDMVIELGPADIERVISVLSPDYDIEREAVRAPCATRFCST